MKIASLYDMHVHLHEYPIREIERLGKLDMILIAVSEDIQSFYSTLNIADTLDNVIPCAGYHPWNFREGGSIFEATNILQKAYHYDIFCIGEIGLDKKFVPIETWNAQVEVARLFLKFASEIGGYVTLHAPSAWRELLEILIEMDVGKAMFHWYTGSINLANIIINYGYYISINPAVRIQEKHRRIAREIGINHIVLESDGPYRYRGLHLSPLMIMDTINLIADLKGLSKDYVLSIIKRNSMKLLYS